MELRRTRRGSSPSGKNSCIELANVVTRNRLNYSQLSYKIGFMDDLTKNLTNGRSFEDRIFARFDAMIKHFDRVDAGLDQMDKRFDGVDTRLEVVDTRLDRLEANTERYALDTRPIWERALAEIIDVRQMVSKLSHDFAHLDRKIDVLNKNLLDMRANQVRTDERLDQLESREAT